MSNLARLSVGLSAMFAMVVTAGGTIAQGAAPGADKKAAPATNAADTKKKNWKTTPVPTPGGDGQVIMTGQAEAIKKVTAYFNALQNLTGKFHQIDANKKASKGKFYLKRPGRFRFEYGGGTKKVIISDGIYMSIEDRDLDNDDTYQLDKTPFRLLLQKDVDLMRDASILEAGESDDKIMLRLKDKDPDAPGTIQLMFTKKPKLELTGWTIVDGQNQQTIVTLSDITTPEKLDAKLFVRAKLFKKKLQSE